MAYIHHHYFVQVTHCDVRHRNVFMGEYILTTQLTKFGITTICFASHENSTFSSKHALEGSIGYIPPIIIDFDNY